MTIVMDFSAVVVLMTLTCNIGIQKYSERPTCVVH